MNMLVGTWIPTQAEMGGQSFPDDVLRSMKLLLSDDKYKAYVGNKVDQGTIKIDKSKHPKAMEITGVKGPNQGKTILAIYEVVGDNLTICYDMSGQAYPTDFESLPDTQLFLVNYQRYA